MDILIKDVNFLPEYLNERNNKTVNSLKVFFCILVILALITGLILTPKAVYEYYDMQRAPLGASIKLLSDVQKKMGILSELNTNSSQKELVLNQLQQSQIRVTETMNKINNAIPPVVSLRTYSISGESVILSFNVDGPLQTIELIRSLENLNMFDKILAPTITIVDKPDTLTISLTLKHK